MLTVGIYGTPDVAKGPWPAYTHDHGIALMRDGRVLTVVQLERWTGRKHDNTLPRHIGALLAHFVKPDEPVRFVSSNVFVGDGFWSEDGSLRIEPAEEVGIPGILHKANCRWYPDGATPRQAEAWIICHEFAHIASALPFCGAFQPGALLVHIDGGASRSACSFWRWDGERAHLLHHAWDDLKDVVNNFNVNPLARAILAEPATAHLSIPGKLMGFAGRGHCDDNTYSWLREHRWFLDHPGDEQSLLDAINARRAAPLARFDPRDPGLMALAAGLQRAFEEEVVAAILRWAEKIDARHLVYSGGAALNIPTNRLLVESGRFDSIHIPPPCSDAGLPLGAAAWVEFLDHGPLPRHSPFLHRFDVDDDEVTVDVEQVAKAIAQGQVVGLCTGAGEVGPRALGHRSILARADDPDLRSRVSEGVKRREWYRPLAPVLCEEAAVEVLGEQAASAEINRFMLGAWPVREAWREALRGVVHQDGSVRPQVVSAQDEDNRFLHRLLRCLWEQHGLPGVINTSFNVKGQPILQKHDQAIDAGRRMGLDAVVLPNQLWRA